MSGENVVAQTEDRRQVGEIGGVGGGAADPGDRVRSQAPRPSASVRSGLARPGRRRAPARVLPRRLVRLGVGRRSTSAGPTPGRTWMAQSGSLMARPSSSLSIRERCGDGTLRTRAEVPSPPHRAADARRSSSRSGTDRRPAARTGSWSRRQLRSTSDGDDLARDDRVAGEATKPKTSATAAPSATRPSGVTLRKRSIRSWASSVLRAPAVIGVGT